ncbi:hypothetical protein [Streptomyces sp. NPDC055134]
MAGPRGAGRLRAHRRVEPQGAGAPLAGRVGRHDDAPRLLRVVLDDGPVPVQQALDVERVAHLDTERGLALGDDHQVERDEAALLVEVGDGPPARLVHRTHGLHERGRVGAGSKGAQTTAKVAVIRTTWGRAPGDGRQVTA